VGDGRAVLGNERLLADESAAGEEDPAADRLRDAAPVAAHRRAAHGARLVAHEPLRDGASPDGDACVSARGAGEIGDEARPAALAAQPPTSLARSTTTVRQPRSAAMAAAARPATLAPTTMRSTSSCHGPRAMRGALSRGCIDKSRLLDDTRRTRVCKMPLDVHNLRMPRFARRPSARWVASLLVTIGVV